MAKEIKRTAIGEKIREYRKKLRLTQEEASEKLGILRTTYARYETDTIPPTNILIKICALFGITTDEILGCQNEYNTAAPSPESSFVNFSSINTYSYDNGFTQEELETLFKITSMSKEKREELMKYIENVVEDENLL